LVAINAPAKKGENQMDPHQENKPGENKPVEIHIDNKGYKAPKNPMTGHELKQLSGVPANYDLWKKVPGKDDDRIKDDQSVQLKNGDHFYSAPSSLNPGC
jgi:hypothetical protein